MTFVSVTHSAEFDRLKKLPILAVDVGFSTSGASCGLAWRIGDESDSKNCNFGAAIKDIISKVAPLSDAVLILEAPLSSSFHRSGRPASRGSFEDATLKGGYDTRYWSQSPGVGMAFAAFLLLRKLAVAVSDNSPRIHLVEGFVSRDKTKRKHRVVAEALRDEFLKPKPATKTVTTESGGLVISVLELLDPRTPAEAPVILIPPVFKA